MRLIGKMRYFKLVRFYILIVISVVFIVACSSSDKKEILSAEELYNQAMEEFNDEDYLEARLKFEAVKLQYPASKYADDAQFYSAECYFKREEYIIAAYNYNNLRRSYPGSPFYKESMYKAGLCLYLSAPKYDRDQENTLKAVKALSEFQSVYSDDSLAKVANEYIVDLRNRMAEREFFTAGLYRKLASPNSALIYYDEVIKSYDDTKFYEDSFLGKVEVLMEMKKFDKAYSAIDLYLSIFKSGQYIDKMKELEKIIPSEFK
jgi:outer membrane protein assembly factor BamD